LKFPLRARKGPAEMEIKGPGKGFFCQNYRAGLGQGFLLKKIKGPGRTGP